MENVNYELFEAQIKTGDSFSFKPDLIKIDVEGVESEVVAGFEETIMKFNPILLVENGDYYRLFPIIERIGYMAMMPSDDYQSLIPFSGTRTNTFYIKA